MESTIGKEQDFDSFYDFIYSYVPQSKIRNRQDKIQDMM